MVFTKVDPLDPTRAFTFDLRVRPDNTYAGERQGMVAVFLSRDPSGVPFAARRHGRRAANGTPDGCWEEGCWVSR